MHPQTFREKRFEEIKADPSLDLGDEHYLKWFVWSPDRELNPQYADLPDLDPAGATIWHRDSNGNACAGAVNFASPQHDAAFGNKRVTWDVESLDPLTISPSVLCECGDHGFIREGKWVRA